VRRDEALAVLGLPADAGPDAVRRRFRALARERHPDRGGDPAAFAELDRAYAALRDLPAPARPGVARGRPSRTPSAPAVGADGDAEILAAALRARRDPATGAALVRLISVAPGARRNRLAAALPEGTLSVLALRVGGAGTEARLTVRARAARRAVAALALDGPDLGAPWTRRRGDAAIELRCTPRADAGVEGVVGPAARLLSALGWPVADWVPEA
jgi:curved DNA-binding protein CbpA